TKVLRERLTGGSRDPERLFLAETAFEAGCDPAELPNERVSGESRPSLVDDSGPIAEDHDVVALEPGARVADLDGLHSLAGLDDLFDERVARELGEEEPRL